jgi:hypothetical protein
MGYEGDVADALEIERAELLALLMNTAGDPSGEPSLRPRERDGPVPLSFAQERLWVLDQLQPGGSEYNIPIFFRLNGELNLAALEQSFCEIVRRHETLRTRIAAVNGDPVQVIEADGKFDLALMDLSGLAEEDRQAELLRQLARFTKQPFDLATAPLFRSPLVKLSEREHVVVLVLHHIIIDGWSMRVLIDELST